MQCIEEIGELSVVDRTAELTSLVDWLDEAQGFPAVGVILRLSEDCQHRVLTSTNSPNDINQALRESLYGPLQEVRAGWAATVGADSFWNNIQSYPAIHTCLIRGPIAKLQEFFDSSIARSDDSPMLGYIFGDALCSPESAQSYNPIATANGRDLESLLESFGYECVQMGFRGKAPEEVSVIAAANPLISSLGGQRIIRNLARLLGISSNSTDVLGELFSFDCEHSYLQHLGIGDTRLWGSNAGAGQTVCIIDSGADESHPMLQQQVAHYARFDTNGHFKEAFACMDHACHGSKIAAWICGKPMDLSDLGHAGRGKFRLGIAPGAKTVVISAMSGDLTREFSTWDQLFSALQFAVDNRNRFCYEVVTICLECVKPAPPSVRERLNLLFLLLNRQGLVPILPAGNRGSESCTLTNFATHVGALDAKGDPCPNNGPRVDLLAPGIDLYCAHPRTPRLNNGLIGKYSGSSLAAAIVSGAVVVLAGAKRISAARALQLLSATSLNGRIDIDRAFKMN